MKLITYYIIIFALSAILYLGAMKAKKTGKKAIQYICYFFLFLVVLFLV